ncbi:MAG: patatin-like phospholipase family protein [Saprospiraceae bacterium]|nr:patatin-like phospholipase family protein [Saprospiraceae bacterium]MDW8483624.1 patatin-like phospholipase family protein [Saprospiraceae bacterium]
MAASFDPHDPPEYVERTFQVITVERERYLKKRRELNKLPPLTDDNIVGLAISGGGIRSATLGLGMLQAFIRAGILKRFDYMSTVSGGGYIGACLSSLLSQEPNNVRKYGPPLNDNERYKPEEAGLDEENCPLSPKIDYEYEPLESTRLTSKHQLLHLRRYGEYLTPRRSFFSWDVSRAVGALISGLIIHMVLFLLLLAVVVLIHHVLFAALSKGLFIETLQHPAPFYNAHHPHAPIPYNYLVSSRLWENLSMSERISRWFSWHLWPQLYLIGHAAQKSWPLVCLFFALGGLSAWIAVLFSRRLPERIARMENEEARYKRRDTDRYYDRPGGQNIFQFVAKAFERNFLGLAYLLGPGLSYLTAIALSQLGYWRAEEHTYFVMMALPAAFASGLLIVALATTSLFFVNNASEKVAGRLYRSFYTGIQGTAFMGLVLSLLFPLGIILLFGEHGLLARLLISFVPVATAYYFTAQTLASKTGISGLWEKVLRTIKKPLLNLSIFLLIGLALAWVSAMLFRLEEMWVKEDAERLWVASWMLLIFGGLLVLLGFAANSNDISLHYFYRDRLTEAFLRTEGRVQRHETQIRVGEGATSSVHPKGLFDVTLRNHENLRLANLGDGNGKAPYHIIVAALNLQGTEDLAQKSQKSDHFIFSKYFIGSRTTGYYRTDRYRGGGTKLSTAMTISAAVVSGGRGYMSFAASNFYLTLLNLRTGYWIDNPWYLHKEVIEEQLRKEGIIARHPFIEHIRQRLRRYPFWLSYLLREMTGELDARTRKVYVSDGGHTGDNLGLLPLLQRRCRTIVVGDFEEDASFTFASLGQAVRLAKSIYDIEIEIDLRPLIPRKLDVEPTSASCVAIGRIKYPASRNGPAMEGQLVYLKSSLAQTQEGEPIPVYVLNYARLRPDFPHESTSDHYFDERQFEAYRMLGDYIGRQAIPHIRFP